MKLKTKNFGEIEIDEKEIVKFEEGIPGFENQKKWVLLADDEIPVQWLQAIEEDIVLPIINPFGIKEDYAFEIPQKIVLDLKIEKQEDLWIFSVVTIPEDIKGIRANLQAPIVINIKEKLGKQLILSDQYEIRYEFYGKIGEK